MADRTHKQVKKFSFDWRVPQRWSVELSTVSPGPGLAQRVELKLV